MIAINKFPVSFIKIIFIHKKSKKKSFTLQRFKFCCQKSAYENITHLAESAVVLGDLKQLLY